MAHLLNCHAVTVTVAARTLLDEVSLGVDDGDRVGVVGRNGDGKSTLLRVIVGSATPDAGRVSVSAGTRVGYLQQVDALDAEVSVLRAVVGDAAEHEWAGQARVRDIIDGLLRDIETTVPGGLDAPVGVLSGGQRRRVALAAVLVGDYDVLVLDEPTNHLDVEGVAWLAEHLRGRWPSTKGGLLLVTHDRWFLDAVCTTTWEVHDGNVHLREGGYAAYVLARAERDRMEAVTAARTANLVRKELAWLRRGAPARTSKPKFRVDAATALVEAEPEPRDTVSLVKTAAARLGKDVFDVVDMTYAIPGEPPRTLFDTVTWRVGPGDRYGIVGTNGAGKSTLLRLLVGGLTPTAGRIKRGKTVVHAVLSQDLSELDDVSHLSAVEAVTKVRSFIEIDGKEMSAAQLTERLGFTRQRARTLVSELSGGERRRLQLARLLMAEPNVLILDEPTNDLDTDTLTAMEDVLDSFAGTLLVVSHDRYLLERITDRQVGILGDGHVRDLPGGVDEYLTLRRRMTSASAPSPAVSPAPASTPVSGAQLRAAQKLAAKLERQLGSLQASLDRVMEKMAEAATDHERMAALDAERAQLAERIEETEMQWLQAAEVADSGS